jgi:hypothetical protein
MGVGGFNTHGICFGNSVGVHPRLPVLNNPNGNYWGVCRINNSKAKEGEKVIEVIIAALAAYLAGYIHGKAEIGETKLEKKVKR